MGRTLRAGKSAGFALAVVIAAGSGISAHRLDECLQAARIAIEPDHIAIDVDVTPGIAVAEDIIGDVDRNGDGVLSAGEQAAYARLVLASLDVSVNGREMDLVPGATAFPDVEALRRGEATIRVRSTVPLSPQASGAHQVRFRNHYRREMSVYLANALVSESARIAITGQRREAQQRELIIAYDVRDPVAGAPAWWLLTGIAVVLGFVAIDLSRLMRLLPR
jgi:hypothetical protein